MISNAYCLLGGGVVVGVVWLALVVVESRRGDLDDTFIQIYEEIRWSTNVMSPLGGNRMPRVGNKNRALPAAIKTEADEISQSGMFYVCWGFQGDFEYFQNHLRWPAHNAANPCKLDPSTNVDGPFAKNRFNDDAGWIQNQLTPLEAKGGILIDHPYLYIYGATVFFYLFDSMHCFECHGTTSHAIANTLYYIVYYQMRGLLREKAARLCARINEIYVELGEPHRFKQMTLGMFVADPRAPHQHYPVLGSSIKAAETKALTKVAFQLACEWNDESPHCRQRVVMLRFLCQYYASIDAMGVVPTMEEGVAVFDVVKGFLLSYQWLSTWALDNNMYMYSVVHKFHLCYHIGQQARYLNPKVSWNYKNEDFEGVMSTLGQSTTFGTAAMNLSYEIAEKYRAAVHMEWTRFSKGNPAMCFLLFKKQVSKFISPNELIHQCVLC
jgi:hypothetical protein